LWLLLLWRGDQLLLMLLMLLMIDAQPIDPRIAAGIQRQLPLKLPVHVRRLGVGIRYSRRNPAERRGVTFNQTISSKSQKCWGLDEEA
jgi:hypothetical protein